LFFRIVRFAFVGGVCALIQILLLYLLVQFLPPLVSNAIGFVVSAQLNFFLSYFFTWRDSARKSGLGFFMTWLRFNGVVLAAAAINTFAFAVLEHVLSVPRVLAVIGAIVISTSCTFLVNHFIVLRPERMIHEPVTRNSNVPASLE